MRKFLMVLSLLLAAATSAVAQVSIQIGLPEANIGINVSSYPQFVRVPDYPVYYAPRLRSNYFFYDGLYWVYRNDNWYASYWYNGPWGLVEPYAVPLYILRVPVRYYYQRPSRFASWRADAPPHWGEVWGSEWQQRRSGWDRWNRSAAPAPAPLPVYQQQYSGNRYPRVEQQTVLQTQNYRYQPREPVVRQFYQARGVQQAPAAAAPRPAPPVAQSAQPAPRAPQQPVARQESRAAPQPSEPRAQQPREQKAAPQAQEQREMKQAREPKAAPQQEPRAAPKQESRAAPQQAPQPEPKAAPRPAPQQEPRSAPKQESRAAPQQAPQPEPKAAPRPAPQQEPRAAPQQAPQQQQKATKQAPQPNEMKGPDGPQRGPEPKGEPQGDKGGGDKGGGDKGDKGQKGGK